MYPYFYFYFYFVEEKLVRRQQGQLNKGKGLDKSVTSSSKDKAKAGAESTAPSNWAVLTDDVNATQKIATSLYYNNPANSSIGGKSGVVKTKPEKSIKRKVCICMYMVL